MIRCEEISRRALLTALAILSTAGLVSCASLSNRVRSIGEVLCEKAAHEAVTHPAEITNVVDVVYLGPKVSAAVFRTVKEARSAPEIRVLDNDYLFMDRSVTHSLILENETGKGIGIRLRYDRAKDAFHIVGFAGFSREWYERTKRTGWRARSGSETDPFGDTQ